MMNKQTRFLKQIKFFVMKKSTKKLENLVEKAVSGAMGKELILRENGEGGTLAEKPTIDPNRVPTVKQEEQQQKFKEAAAYGTSVLANPELKETYEMKTKKKRNAFKAAVTDYLSVPEVRKIDVSDYNGTVGSKIAVRAQDDFSVTQVKVSIHNAAGDLVEEGLAVLEPVLKIKWIYTATQVVAILPGSKIKAIVQDIPGNKSELQITL
jgi:hypothetical protein